jgi:DNA-binding transcriptional regulator/RsmH inhibitor MraZ
VYGRLRVPLPMRTHLTAGVVATLGSEGGVDVYPTRLWEQHIDAIRQEVDMGGGGEHLADFLEGNAADRRLDARGRLALPPFLIGRLRDSRDRAVRVVGAGDHIEIRRLAVPRTLTPTSSD